MSVLLNSAVVFCYWLCMSYWTRPCLWCAEKNKGQKMNKATRTALGTYGAFTHDESGHTQQSSSTNQRSCLILIRKHIKRAASLGVQIKKTQAECCDPAASHNDNERAQQRFIQQEASEADAPSVLFLLHSCESVACLHQH